VAKAGLVGGDWDIAAGQYFTTFRREVHVVGMQGRASGQRGRSQREQPDGGCSTSHARGSGLRRWITGLHITRGAAGVHGWDGMCSWWMSTRSGSGCRSGMRRR